MKYRLYIPGQTTVQKAQKLISSLRPEIYSEITRTSEAGGNGCSWSITVEAESNEKLEFVLGILQYNGVSVQRVTTENGANWGGVKRRW
jgi:hypothetical protein